ncbi:GtrA family protein [Comamonas sp. J-3]|uniref:GtrA family protein n=1 Tax=Comamonas trifloxystrobinivorans TaxID=3350256 RepID=UPI0037281C12
MPLISTLRRLPQSLQFVCVGAAAAATHLLVVALLVQTLAWAPLAANVVGFLLAFCVSYSGHAMLTFSAQHSSHQQALPRFFLVACSSFLLNEALYYAALHWLHWPYLPSLFAVLVIVAVVTFVAAKFWAFAKGAA